MVLVRFGRHRVQIQLAFGLRLESCEDHQDSNQQTVRVSLKGLYKQLDEAAKFSLAQPIENRTGKLHMNALKNHVHLRPARSQEEPTYLNLVNVGRRTKFQNNVRQTKGNSDQVKAPATFHQSPVGTKYL